MCYNFPVTKVYYVVFTVSKITKKAFIIAKHYRDYSFISKTKSKLPYSVMYKPKKGYEKKYTGSINTYFGWLICKYR